MTKDYGLRFEDILKYAQLAIVSLKDSTPTSVLDDPLRLAAIERCFTIIGEAAYKLPRLERGQYPQLPWQKMTGLRHRLVHGYDGIDHPILVDTVLSDLPKLVEAIQPYLSQKTAYPAPIKICGLSTPETMNAALGAGADMVGLVFHRKSPRSISLEKAGELAAIARGRAIIVALTVDPSDEGVDAIMKQVNPDLIQLHGSETPERCAAISEHAERPVMKAVGVADAGDLAAIKAYRPHVDRLLLDAKPPKDAAYPGGHGKTFDWQVLKGLDPFMPFMLSGGLTPENVGDAIHIVRNLGITLAGVDVSSGVESAPGIKDSAKIRAFIENARIAIPSPRLRGEG
jgi:phosphoribosylanthranilate isomerase